MTSVLIGYARVSSEDQDLTIQRVALEAAGCYKIFEEKRSGKTKDNRPALEKALTYCRKGDTFVVTRLDRLGRSVHDLSTILHDLDKRGVIFRCTEQPECNMDSAMSRLMLQMLGAFAEFELNIRKERQREGIKSAKMKGVYQARAEEYRLKREMYRGHMEALFAKGIVSVGLIAKVMKLQRASIYRIYPEGPGGKGWKNRDMSHLTATSLAVREENRKSGIWERIEAEDGLTGD